MKNGVLTIDEGGFITDIDSDDEIDRRAGIEFYGGILIPGMVNAHTHLELSYMKGLIPSGSGMAGFARGMRASRESVPADERVKAAEYQDAKMWSEGVSAVADICNGATTFAIKKRSPILYHSFVEVYGLTTASADNALLLAAQAHAEGFRASVTPHSTYSLNEAAFADALSGGDPVSIHFMESPEETELYEGKGALAEWYRESGLRCDFTDGRYCSPAGRIEASVEPGRRMLLVHNTFISPEDARSLAGRFGDGLTWVVCPCSNEYITGTLPPVEMLLSTGAEVAVGTDSLVSNTSLSLIEELKALPGLPLETALHMATLAGARALGIDEYGSLEVGKRPGIVLLTGADLSSMTLTPEAATRRIV